MDLKLEKRIGKTQSGLGAIRRNGDIPAVFYLREKKGSVSITVNGVEFAAFLRRMQKGCLATELLTVEYEGKKVQALVKDISYHRVTYAIEHLDLMEVTMDDQVQVNVPVICKGDDVCPGITQGGQLKIVKRALETSVMVKEMPKWFLLDISTLQLGGSVRIRDLVLTPSMKIAIQRDQVLVVVSK
jgi:large subunit ribosomal protein L25